jgi:hypothetical protein
MATKIKVQSQCEYAEAEKRPLSQYLPGNYKPRMVRCEGITNKDAHLCDYHAELRRQEVAAND